MPVFYTPIPQNVRMGLAQVSGSVFVNNRTRDSGDLRENAPATSDNAVFEVASHLPLQMLLYFNVFYFPFWWISAIVMLDVKFSLLPTYYKCLLVTGMILLTIFEVTRLYLGWVGNLKEKVPELAGFWLLTFLLQLPILLFFVTDEGILILPLERAVHSIYLLFVLGESLAAFLALRIMTRKLSLQFHLRQLGEVENLHPVDNMAPGYGRSVLPMPTMRNIHPQ